MSTKNSQDKVSINSNSDLRENSVGKIKFARRSKQRVALD